ncbi:MAG: aromatic aminobenezylarsenical efflux permease ArsG family transporter [Paludibacter sp.]|nr:aromatic aminobenezylarsenical efflux permease ArsG family transporter [Paludibacter sp.]
MEVLRQLTDSSQLPLLTALLLGLMTAISPCPLATNITAIGFIGKDLHDKRKIFLNGIFYTLGRAFTYTVLGSILIVILKQGGSIFKIQQSLSLYGGYFLGPILILIGLFMLDVLKLNFTLKGATSEKMEKTARKGTMTSSFLIGVIFALAFCPYSGLLYFGGLIPLAVASQGGIFLPLAFALATGLPVLIFAWILAYSVSSVGSFYSKLKNFEYWFRRVVAVLFIGVGIYYVLTFYF